MKPTQKELNHFVKFVLPTVNYLMSSMTWGWLTDPQSFESAHISLIWLIAIVALTRNSGFKTYLPMFGKKLFSIAFIAPLTVALIGVFGGYVYIYA